MLNKVIDLRKKLHQNAEESLKEFKTQEIIIKFIKDFGIKDKQIKICGETGLIVKLFGKSKKIDNPRNIMIRADMDAWPMEENNNLEYKSITNFSHLCGHDGHMAILIYSMYLTIENLEKIPLNCSISFLFQPGEEGSRGAKKQIDDGCLEGIDEIYGLHNMLFDKPGDIFLKEGIMMSACYKYEINFIGKGGDIYLKYNLNNSVLASCEFIILAEKYINSLKNKKDLILCFPQIEASNKENFIPNSTFISGFSRSFDYNLLIKLDKIFFEISSQIEKKYNLKIEIKKKYISEFPVDNNKELTKEIIQILNNKFDQVRNEFTPVLASEDFSDFQRIIPGVFLFLGIGYKKSISLHNENYIFNDNVIEKGAKIWLEIILKRLNTK